MIDKHNMQNHPDDRTCKIVHKWRKRRTGRSWEKVTTQLAIEYDISDYLISPLQKETIKHIKNKYFAMDQEDWYAELWDDRQCENGNK